MLSARRNTRCNVICSGMRVEMVILKLRLKTCGSRGFLLCTWSLFFSSHDDYEMLANFGSDAEANYSRDGEGGRRHMGVIRFVFTTTQDAGCYGEGRIPRIFLFSAVRGG